MERFLGLGRAVIGAWVAVAMLAGCGGSATGSVPPELTQGVARLGTTHAVSWMLPEAKSEALLYVSDDIGDIDVFSYPKLKLTGHLNVGADTGGLCAGKNGTIFVPAWVFENHTSVTGYVYEYAHGQTQPIATLDDPGALNSSCSVDPTTGNLAVTNSYQSGYGYGNVLIFPNASGTPNTYIVTTIEPGWAAYDASGNLFVDGYDGSTSPLAELRTGSSDFTSITLSKSIYPLSLQWADGHLAIVSEAYRKAGKLVIYRVSVSGDTANVVGSTSLNIRRIDYGGNGQYFIQSARVLGAGSQHYQLDVWHYPAGGKVTKVILKRFTPWGIALSSAPSTTRTR